MSKNSAPSFVIAQPDESSTPNTVLRVDACVPHFVEYLDERGKKQARIALTVPGADEVYVLQERITGTPVVTAANPWFAKGVQNRLRSQEKRQDGLKQIGD